MKKITNGTCALGSNGGTRVAAISAILCGSLLGGCSNDGAGQAPPPNREGSETLDGAFPIDIAPPPRGAAEIRGLRFTVEVDERENIFFGEPVYVRFRLYNPTDEPISIPFASWPHFPNETVSFIITYRTMGDQQALPYTSDPPDGLGGYGTLTVPPQTFYVFDSELMTDYQINFIGRYQVEVQVKIEGEVVRERLRDLQLARGPEAEREALRVLVGGFSPGYPSVLKRLYEPVNEEALREVIEEHPRTRYATYARYHLAWERTMPNAQDRLELLEAIDLEGFPPLFQERVLLRLIRAHAAARSDEDVLKALIAEFYERFPDSPYKRRIPAWARELVDKEG